MPRTKKQAIPVCKVKRMSLEDLNPAPYNPRKTLGPGDPEYQTLRASYESFGQVLPLVWNKRTGNLVGGHQGRQIMIDIGVTSAPVSIVDLDDGEERALNIALNRISGRWDFGLLSEVLDGLDPEMQSLAGFEPGDLTEILADLEPAEPDEPVEGETDPDDAPEPSLEPPKTQRGDLWVLGDSRLLCGDATSADDVARLLGGAEPALMVTDPPYGVEYDGGWRDEASPKEHGVSGKVLERVSGSIEGDTRADWTEVWRLFEGTVAYVYHAGSKAPVVARSLTDAGLEIRACLVWNKPQAVISRAHYSPKHEPLFYAVRGECAWVGPVNETTVWDIMSMSGWGRVHDADNYKSGHPTQKPVECMERPIRNHEGEVYDPFSGSGTTLIAAHRQKRRCYAMEIDPAYVDVAVARWEAYTGQEATLIEAGQ